MSLSSLVFVTLFGAAIYLNGRFLSSPVEFVFAKTPAAKGLLLAFLSVNAGLMFLVRFDLMVLFITWLLSLTAALAAKLYRGP